MEGPENPDEVTEGMIPRAVSQIFETAESLKDKGWQVIIIIKYCKKIQITRIKHFGSKCAKSCQLLNFLILYNKNLNY